MTSSAGSPRRTHELSITKAQQLSLPSCGLLEKALSNSPAYPTRKLRSALGTVAIIELIGIDATRQITNPETWYSHKAELKKLGIDISRKPGPKPELAS